MALSRSLRQVRIHLIDPKLEDPALRADLERKAASGVGVVVLGGPQVHGLRSHGKLLIVDDRVAAIGSMALSASHLDTRCEVAVVVQDARLVKSLVRFFDTAAGSHPVLVFGRQRDEAIA